MDFLKGTRGRWIRFTLDETRWLDLVKRSKMSSSSEQMKIAINKPFQEASQICRMTGAWITTAQQRGSQGHHCSQGVPMLGKGDTGAQSCSSRPVIPPERQTSSSLTAESLKSALRLPHIPEEGARWKKWQSRRRACTLTQGEEWGWEHHGVDWNVQTLILEVCASLQGWKIHLVSTSFELAKTLMSTVAVRSLQ